MAKSTAKRGTLYLYADGHAVQIWEDSHPQAGPLYWVELIEEYGPEIRMQFEGRIYFSGWAGLGQLAKRASRIRIFAKNGTSKTQELGIACVTLTLIFPDIGPLHFHDMPGLMSGDFSHDPNLTETFNPDLSVWADMRVAKVTRKPQPKATAATQEGA